MIQEFLDMNTFNRAREAYIEEDYKTVLQKLNSIAGLDYNQIRNELISKNGNRKYLENLIETRGDKIMGIFDCPYHPYLSLEYSKLIDVYPTIEIEHKFNNIRCVKQIESSIGLSNEQVVAIFPENFRSVSPEEKFPVFYFVDKFAKRHIKFTRPMVNRCHLNKLFIDLNELEEQDLIELIANWVNIHEASHRLGDMPIPKFLYEKSNRFTAAFEELRADLNTIFWCLKKCSNKESNEYLTALYVLAERLLAYPQFRGKYNFDSISSIFLWKYMNEMGALSGDETLDSILDSIENLISFLIKMEKESMVEKSPEARKMKLKSLIIDFLGDYELEFEKYNKFWSQK